MTRTVLPLAASPAPPGIDAEALRRALAASVQGDVRFDRLSRALYATDASVYQIVPLGVVLPRTEEDIIATLRICADFQLPLTARGGGTSQAGQCIGPGVILDCSRYFNQVLEINTAERWARVQPGCVLDELNRQVKPHNLQFAPDISTANRATIGGMIANNSSGTHSIIHGKTIDHVQELKVLLADGTVTFMGPLSSAALDSRCAVQDHVGACCRLVRHLGQIHAEEIDRRFPRIIRRVGGYNLDRFTPAALSRHPFNLAHLLVGSEGTLGLILEAKLGLVELPGAQALLVIQFNHLLDALAATPAILEHQPAAVEVIDKFILDSTLLNPEAARLRTFVQGDPAAILLVEFFADSPAELPARLDALEAALRGAQHGCHYHRATDPQEQARIWKLRKLSLGLSMAEKGDAKAISFVEDTAVQPESLRDYMAEFLEVVRKHGTRAGVYAHASVGCLHVRPIVDLKTEAGAQQFQAIAGEVADLVLKYGGALSGEHGDGLVRSPFQEKMYGHTLYQAFKEIKHIFDPLRILNPGKIVDAPPLLANLRHGPAHVTPQVPTTFSFAADGGLARAAELCAGVGECRKLRGGTMCPSFQVTGDEQHSTRGRANALRLAITGQLGLQGLTDPAVKEVLDLCLECKACKSECPTNVDMARLKAEFLHQYYRRHRIPWRNWLFANVSTLTRRGGRLANRWLRSRLGRWLNDKLFAIDHRRMPPEMAEFSFADQWWQLPDPADPRAKVPGDSGQFFLPGRPSIDDARPHLVLFPDTFMNYFEPILGLASLELFRQAGWAVEVGLLAGSRLDGFPPNTHPAGLQCCGRPHISNGYLTQAVALARANVKALYPRAAAGHPIIACEPSCLLTIKDDYPAMLSGDERRQADLVAAMCRTFEEQLLHILETRPALRFRPGPRTILVQGHCHQQSLVGMGPTLRLLKHIPGAEVINLDAGCCGLAGSFGYEKEHYELSRLVGEQRLFPALRQAKPGTVVVAPGFSCRLQINHFTGMKAVHPAELLLAHIDPGASGQPNR